MDVNCVPVAVTGIDWAKVIPAIWGAILSIVVTIVLFFYKNSIDKAIRIENQTKTDLDILDKQLDDILKIAVSYPYLEMKTFCDTWDVDKAQKGDECEKYQRYSIFCNLVFNYLARLAEHCDYDVDCIQKQHINMKDWVRLHQKNWDKPLNDPNENIDSYDAKFVTLVNKCLGRA